MEKDHSKFNLRYWYTNMLLELVYLGSQIFDLQFQEDIGIHTEVLYKLEAIESEISDWFLQVDDRVQSKKFKEFSVLALQNSRESFLLLEESFLDLELEELSFTKETTKLIEKIEKSIRKIINFIDYLEIHT